MAKIGFGKNEEKKLPDLDSLKGKYVGISDGNSTTYAKYCGINKDGFAVLTERLISGSNGECIVKQDASFTDPKKFKDIFPLTEEEYQQAVEIPTPYHIHIGKTVIVGYGDENIYGVLNKMVANTLQLQPYIAIQHDKNGKSKCILIKTPKTLIMGPVKSIEQTTEKLEDRVKQINKEIKKREKEQ